MPPKAIFAGQTFAISGKLAQPQKAYEELIKTWGGAFATSVSATVTCLVTNEADAKAVPTPAKVATALGRGVPLVNEGFLGACISAKKLLDHEKFAISGLKKRKARAAGAVKGPKASAKKAKAGGVISSSPTSKVLERSGLADKAMVVKEAVVKAFGEACLTWDVELVLTDDDGRDKFYNMQMLVNKAHTQFWTVAHQGWTGLKGRVNVDGPFPDVDSAKKVFRRKYRQKTGNVFGLHGTFEEVEGKYRVLAAEEEEADEDPAAGEAPAAAGASSGVAKAKKAEGPPVWQYYLHNKVDGKPIGWYNYEGESVENIEKFWRQSKNNDGLDVRVIRSDYFTYEVNYKFMLQTNVKTGTRRVIRRLHPKEEPSADAPAVIPDKVAPKKPIVPEEEEEDDEDVGGEDEDDDDDGEAEDEEPEVGAVAPAEADELPVAGGRSAPAAAPAAEPTPASGGRAAPDPEPSADPAPASRGRGAPAASGSGRSAPAAADDAETDDGAEPESPATRGGGGSTPAPVPAASLRGTVAADDAETVPAFDEALAETLPLPTARR